MLLTTTRSSGRDDGHIQIPDVNAVARGHRMGGFDCLDGAHPSEDLASGAGGAAFFIPAQSCQHNEKGKRLTSTSHATGTMHRDAIEADANGKRTSRSLLEE